MTEISYDVINYMKLKEKFENQKQNKNIGVRFAIICRIRADIEMLMRKDESFKNYEEAKRLLCLVNQEIKKLDEEMKGE